MASSSAGKWAYLVTLSLSLLLFLAACALPVLEVRTTTRPISDVPSMPGATRIVPPPPQVQAVPTLIVPGWRIPFSDFEELTVIVVLANAAIVVAWLALRARLWRWALALVILAPIIAAGLFSINPTHRIVAIERPLIGVLPWLASILVIAAGAIVCDRLAPHSGDTSLGSLLGMRVPDLPFATTIDRVRVTATCLGFYLYLGACVLPALRLRLFVFWDESFPVYPGAIFVPLAPLFWIISTFSARGDWLAWIALGANTPIIAAWIALLLRWWRSALALAVLAVISASATFAINPNGGVRYSADSSGSSFGRAHIDQFLPGSYLWLASMVAIGVGAAVCWWLASGTATEQDAPDLAAQPS